MMTEKRFKYNSKTGRMCDNMSNWQCTSNMGHIETHMNDLHYKNVKLSEKNEELQENLNDAINRIEERSIDIQLLKKENEQLKKRIDYLEVQLYHNSDEGVCLICKNHYLEQSTYDKYYISKCRKGHEECSNNVLKYCDDFEFKGDNDDDRRYKYYDGDVE